MNRKDFLAKLAVTTVALNSFSIGNLFAVDNTEPAYFLPDEIRPDELATVSDALKNDFTNLVKWLKSKGWDTYLQSTAGINLRLTDRELDKELVRRLDNLSLENEGLDDFGGIRAIEPGKPAMSLLYHALASPRVHPGGFSLDQFPSLKELDTLENYIYALENFTIPQTELKNNYVVAMFAYEYRPAFKTPHHIHADLVFSRTGIGRIGEKPLNYDASNRCYLNQPPNENDIKNIAVTPARYGLFLAKIVKKDTVALLGTDKVDALRYFLKPVRKIFNHDALIDNRSVSFDEYHKAEKLHRLALDNRIKLPDGLFDIEKAPFIRVSPVDHIVDIANLGSSVLVSSVPEKLVREAWQEAKFLKKPGASNNERLRYEVPKASIENRYYSSFSMLRDLDEADIYILYGPDAEDNRLSATNKKTRPYKESGPKNSPLFVNMRYVEGNNGAYDRHLGAETDNFENVILGSHWAGLFEDSICDGCVAASIDTSNYAGKLPVSILGNCLPAFSLITAPDFFPQVDSFDLLKYDIGNGQSIESNFVEGGVASLSALRKRPNRHTRIPQTNILAFPPVALISSRDKKSMVHDTVTAVLSHPGKKDSKIKSKFTDSKRRSYTSLSFLPDASSSVFAPGWDVTYSNDSENVRDMYLSTRGLGSPFPEDMKLCAAANGMWPAASPDLARAFAGSTFTEDLGDRYIANPTAVPLMDIELGIHEEAPAFKGPKPLTGKHTGWDGEQGPFLKKGLDGTVMVDFTDIGRSDFVSNALAGVYDMSLLRNLTSAELIARMECLRQCIKRIDPKTIVAGTTYWLVSAESITNWEDIDFMNNDHAGAKGYGIPMNLVGDNKNWAIQPQKGIMGKGYLYVFIDAARDAKKGQEQWVDKKGKRRVQKCRKIYVCQGSEDAVAWSEVLQSKPQSASQILWKFRKNL